MRRDASLPIVSHVFFYAQEYRSTRGSNLAASALSSVPISKILRRGFENDCIADKVVKGEIERNDRVEMEVKSFDG